MVSDIVAQALHDRATRGETLSVEEQALLSNWYGEQDEREARILSSRPHSIALDELRADISAATVQLSEVAGRIEFLTNANEVVRRDIEALQVELAQRSTVAQA